MLLHLVALFIAQCLFLAAALFINPFKNTLSISYGPSVVASSSAIKMINGTFVVASYILSVIIVFLLNKYTTKLNNKKIFVLQIVFIALIVVYMFYEFLTSPWSFI